MLIGGLLLDDMPLGRRETPAKGCGCHGCGIRSSSAPAFYRSASGQSQMPEPRSSVVGSRRGGRTRFVFFSACLSLVCQRRLLSSCSSDAAQPTLDTIVPGTPAPPATTTATAHEISSRAGYPAASNGRNSCT